MKKENISILKKRIKELERLVKLQEAEIKELSALSERDALTELYNRKGFIGEAEKFLREVKTLGKIKERRRISFKDFSVIFIDLDNLKLINDKYGHIAGDQALKTLAKIFQDSVRDLDIVARWGGDEFVIGLAGANEKTAFQIVKKLKNKLKLNKINGWQLSASFGIVSYHHKSKSPRFSTEHSRKDKAREKILNQLYELIEKADMTMYEAKKKGKGSVGIYNKKLILE